MTLLADNSINWKIPVKVEVFCDFVDDAGCSHSYLPALDPTYSSVTLCKDTDPNFQLDFATPAQFFGFTFPTSSPDPLFCAVMHHGNQRIPLAFAHGESGILQYAYDPDNEDWQASPIRVSFGTKTASH